MPALPAVLQEIITWKTILTVSSLCNSVFICLHMFRDGTYYGARIRMEGDVCCSCAAAAYSTWISQDWSRALDVDWLLSLSLLQSLIYQWLLQGKGREES